MVLQGRDASGKDGVIKKVIGAVNPLGTEFSSFKVPSDEVGSGLLAALAAAIVDGTPQQNPEALA